MDERLLSDWYADPLTVDEARQLLLEVRTELKQARAGQYLQLRLQEVIARYWLGRDISGDIDNLQAICTDDACRALIELVYGQLLISRKLRSGMDHLQQGFIMATNLFLAAEYLEVLRRHERLKFLVLGEQAADGRALADLLKEAGVIRELAGKPDYHCDLRADHGDTLG